MNVKVCVEYRRNNVATRLESLKESLELCQGLVGFEINLATTELVKGHPILKLHLRRGVETREVLITSNQKGTKPGYIK
tara:strand:- start:2688 stop:2924 length:237 start_codon:yes stop_codon:yes gene_type:complete